MERNKYGFCIFSRKNLAGCKKSYNFAPAFDGTRNIVNRQRANGSVPSSIG